ncbi:MAG: DUF1887 family protein [Kiritimatiellae bacterium]|nr:DUF1887 family protein [Kiritimatiellia bacterium]
MNQVLLISDQPMPNFLPILNQNLRPDTVTFVVSDKMGKRAEWLKNEIAKHQIRILPDIPIGNDTSDIQTIQNALLGWTESNADVFAHSVLNVTGGTKPMAIAAQEVFRMGDRPVFYVDVATDRVTWVNGEEENVILSNQPTLNQFFGLNGITVESGDLKSVVEDERWRHFYREIAQNPHKWHLLIKTLNRIASQAEQDNMLEFNPSGRDLNLPYWHELDVLLHENDLVCHKRGGRQDEFSSSDARRFCNGIWLEHHVFEILKSLRFDKKHALMNVIISDEKGNRNELDAVVLHRNTCYVIEDKTKNMRVGNIADNAVYKLAQLSSRMGLRARGILVSALDVRPADKERARAYNVEVFDQLQTLATDLKKLFKIES